MEPNGNTSADNITESALDEETGLINLVVPPILVVIGNMFNILAILIMRSRYFRTLSTSVFMTACAVNDASSLLISLTSHWLSVNFPDAIIRNQYSHYMCKFFNFYGWSNCDFSIIVTMAMTADRAFAIMYPLKASSADTRKRAKIVLVIITLVVITKQFHFWFTSDMVPAGRKDRMCDVFPPTALYYYFYRQVWPWIHISFLTVCFVIIIASNCVIIRSIRKSTGNKSFKGSFSAKSARRTDCPQRFTSRSNTKWRQTAIMLLTESFTLLLLTYPFSVHLAVTLRMTDQQTDAQTQAVNAFVFSIVFYLLYSNKCVNFCLYFSTGSRFRQALWEILKCNGSLKRFHTNYSVPSRLANVSSEGDICNSGSSQPTGGDQKELESSYL